METAVRLPYSVFYAVSGDVITELRAYFPVLALVERLEAASIVPA